LDWFNNGFFLGRGNVARGSISRDREHLVREMLVVEGSVAGGKRQFLLGRGNAIFARKKSCNFC